MVLTSDCKKKSKAYNYTMKYLENLLFYAKFLPVNFVFTLHQKHLNSLNIFLQKMDHFLAEYFKEPQLQGLVRTYIKDFTQCFLNSGDLLEFQQSERDHFLGLIKQIQQCSEQFRHMNLGKNFEYLKKPQSRRGLHLIGIGRNIKKLKKMAQFHT